MQDAMLRRVARRAAVLCALAAVAAVPLFGWRAAAGVIGGGVLVAISFAAVAYTISVFVRPRDGGDAAGDPKAKRTRKRLLGTAVFAGHYALLALAAYVMIARLRLHPIGLLGGVTSFVAAVALEAARPRGRF